jgi:hypothetical protein
MDFTEVPWWFRTEYGDVVIKWGFHGNITSDNGDFANDNIVTPQKGAECSPASNFKVVGTLWL